MKRFILALLLSVSTHAFADSCVDSMETMLPPYAPEETRIEAISMFTSICSCADDKVLSQGYDPLSDDIEYLKSKFLKRIIKYTAQDMEMPNIERQLFVEFLDNPRAMDAYMISWAACWAENAK